MTKNCWLCMVKDVTWNKYSNSVKPVTSDHSPESPPGCVHNPILSMLKILVTFIDRNNGLSDVGFTAHVHSLTWRFRTK